MRNFFIWGQEWLFFNQIAKLLEELLLPVQLSHLQVSSKVDKGPLLGGPEQSAPAILVEEEKGLHPFPKRKEGRRKTRTAILLGLAPDLGWTGAAF